MDEAGVSERPVVTAIVPTYRRAQLLERSVGSILKQTWRPLEVLVIDDGSGDDTPVALAAFESAAAALGINYRWFTKENGGPGLAKNFAMQRAQGQFFAFLDDDDSWMPTKIERQVAAMLARPEAGASFTRYVHLGKESEPKPKPGNMRDGWVFETLCSGETRAYIQTLMITRRMFEVTGGFGALFQWEDTEFELRLSLHAPFVAVHEALTVISPAPGSMSREAGMEGDVKRDREKLALLDRIIEQNKSHARFNLEATRLLRARVYDEHVKHLLWLGSVDEAREAWNEALSACGELPVLLKLKRKLARAKVAGWFGKKLRKP